MFKNNILTDKFYIVLIILLTLFIILRFVPYINANSGVEHDSAWHLSLAKNLALHGKYATDDNLATIDKDGISRSMFGHPQVEDKDGFVLFPACGWIVGFAFVIPQALIYKIFGVNWWSNRIFTLLSTALLFLLTTIYLYNRVSFIASVTFLIWLLLIPQFYFGYLFESFSENLATLYIFVAYLLTCFLLYKSVKNKKIIAFLVGIFLIFSFYTKNLSAFYIFFFILYFIYKAIFQKEKTYFFILVGLIIPLVAYELFRFIELYRQYGFDAYVANNIHFFSIFTPNGVTNYNQYNLHSFLTKLKMLKWIGIENVFIFLIYFLFLIIFYFILNKKDKGHKLILILLPGLFLNFIWYIFFSPSGFFRHVWTSAYFLIFLYIYLVFSTIKYQKKIIFKLFILFSALLPFMGSTKLYPYLFVNSELINKIYYDRNNDHEIEGVPSTPMFSLVDQQQLVDFFHKYGNNYDRLYFWLSLQIPEVSLLIDKISYPIGRYFSAGNKSNLPSLLVLNPYMINKEKWAFYNKAEIPNIIQQFCAKPVFSNNSYYICELKRLK